jgi:acyl carrier protein
MSSRQEIESTVNDIFIKVFEVDEGQLRPEALLKDLGLDSLDAVDLIVSLEKAFKFRIDEAEARKIRTLGDIYENIARGLAGAKGQGG